MAIDEQHGPDDARPGTSGETEGARPGRRSGRSRLSKAALVVAAVIALDIVAFLVIPPFPKGEPGVPISGIPDLIGPNVELPAPHVVWDLDPANHVDPAAIVFFHPSISATIFTTWIVMAVVLGLMILATRRLLPVPGSVQNVVEMIFEALSNFAFSLGGRQAQRHVPIFAGFFLFILFSNWSGLLPMFGKFEELRAPTSDVNVTIGLALVSFFYFQFQGFRTLGVRGYLGKFFVLSGFRHGFGTGLVDMFVGLIEFFLEFIKPVTLSMRLFGNIFGGEVALGVLTALTIAIIPIGMIGLELLLNFVQALIFSTLTLIFTLIAMEGHHEEEAHAAVPAGAAAGAGSAVPELQAGGAH